MIQIKADYQKVTMSMTFKVPRPGDVMQLYEVKEKLDFKIKKHAILISRRICYRREMIEKSDKES